MAATFLIVPQWQGSGSSRAMRLVEGALAIRADLPGSATITVDVPLEAGDEQASGVARFSSLQLVRDRQAQALSTIEGRIVTIGGDCGVELASITHVSDATDIAVLWFDAHPDLNTPESSPSSAFAGMVLRALLGEGAPGLLPARPLDPRRVILVGTRSFDEREAEFAASRGIVMLAAGEANPEALLAAVEASGAAAVYVHVDLDVLDPATFIGLGNPEPFGLAPAALIELVKAVGSRFPLAGAGITEFAPSSPEHAEDDLPTILRIIAALAS